MKELSADKIDKQILVDIDPYRTRVVLVEDGVPVEFRMERRSTEKLRGNIYKGAVQNVLPGMSAAFVDIGEEKNAFLYIAEAVPIDRLYDTELPNKPGAASVSDIVRVGQDVMVQITKEPIGTKGARASTHITIPGYGLVLIPNVDFVGVSKRITDEHERARLKQIINNLRPKGMGVIARTAADGSDSDVIEEELLALIAEWENIKRTYNCSKAPKLLHREESLISATVRDMLKPDVCRLVVNDRQKYEQIVAIAERYETGLSSKVCLYDDKLDMFERFGIESAIDAALSRRVWLKSGAYIVIDQTEALVSIDVNTGKFVGKADFRKTVVETNKEAAIEIARQLRLRDIGGIIVIDFIDMEDKTSRNAVLDTLRNAVKRDRTKTVVLGMTGLGLVEVNRTKRRESIQMQMHTVCPYCNGSGYVESAETVALRLRRALAARIAEHDDAVGYTVTAHPDVIRLIEQHGGEVAHELGGRTVRWVRSSDMHISEFLVKNI